MMIENTIDGLLQDMRRLCVDCVAEPYIVAKIQQKNVSIDIYTPIINIKGGRYDGAKAIPYFAFSFGDWEGINGIEIPDEDYERLLFLTFGSDSKSMIVNVDTYEVKLTVFSKPSGDQKEFETIDEDDPDNYGFEIVEEK